MTENRYLLDVTNTDLANMLVRLLVKMGGEVELTLEDLTVDHTGSILHVAHTPDGSTHVRYIPRTTN